jgi:hypothetical protein
MLLFDRFAKSFGLMFFCFVIVFIIAFSSVVKFEKLTTSSPNTQGIVLTAEPTNSEVNEQRVFAYEYQFNLVDGHIYKGILFSETIQFEPSNSITIQYSPKNPNI